MIFENLGNDLDKLERDSTLFEPEQLRRRIEAVDALDSVLVHDALGEKMAVVERVRVLRIRLEEANAAVYQRIRREIQTGTGASGLRRWIDLCRDPNEAPMPGLAYDALDELVAGALQIEAPQRAPEHLEPEQVFYQPTPVRHALHWIQLSGISENDVLIDLGSGLGHVCMLVSILTGVRAVGVEVEGAYVASARACATSLGLAGVRFIEEDARIADLSAGTVFWLYTPFSGSMLKAVMGRMQKAAATRTIRVGTLGPCTPVVAEEAWLRAIAPPAEDRVAVFESGG